MRKLRGALLGAGNIAIRGHAPQWTRGEGLRDRVEIVAVADLAPDNLAQARELVPGVRTYERAEDLLASEELDFCDICTPPFTHRELVEAGASRGIHIVCEKPLAMTREEGAAISKAVRGAGVVFQPCHQYRFSPQWKTVHDLWPELGRVFLAEYEVSRTAANPGNTHWAPSWRTDLRLSGGGILVDHGGHVFYQLRALLGEPLRVQATIRTLKHHDYAVEDSAFVLLDFGDRLASVRLTWASSRREIRYRFVGESGELVGDDRTVRLHTRGEAREFDFGSGMSADSSHSDWYLPLFLEFSERVNARDTATGGLDEALYVTNLIDCAYRSSESGRAIDFAGTTDG